MKPHFSFKYERLFLLILIIPNLFIMSFPYVFCKKSVRPKQHALECESCFQCTGYAVQVCLCFIQFLSHLCETLIEIGRYRKLPREDRLCLYCECHFFFHCILNRELRNTLFDHFKKEDKFDIRTEERGLNSKIDYLLVYCLISFLKYLV